MTAIEDGSAATTTLLGDEERATVVAELLTEVATGLTERAKTDTDARRPVLSGEDEQVFAAHLVAEALQRRASAAVARGDAPLSEQDEDAITDAVMTAQFGLGGFQRYLDDPSIENINANGCDEVFIRYADQTRRRVDPVASSDEELITLVRMAAARLGVTERRFDRASPCLTLQLPGGSRLTAMIDVCPRPTVSIRRHRHLDVTLTDLREAGMFNADVEGFLTAAVLARKNIMIAGQTGAGKTTLVRACCRAIPAVDRIITIEETRELELQRWHQDVVALEARQSNVEGEGAVTLAMLYQQSLGMDPDRVIVGEVKGPEVITMLNANSQGNGGSLSTVHADSSLGVIQKLATYAMQTPPHMPFEATYATIGHALHFIVFVARARDGRRVVNSVREIVGYDREGRQVQTNEVFRPGPDGRARPGDPVRQSTIEELRSHGYEPRDHHIGGEVW
jgi:pilus assembly protein CpaF